MYMCMYLYVYVPVCVYSRKLEHHGFASEQRTMCVCVCVCMCIHVHIYIHNTCTSTCIYTCMFIQEEMGTSWMRFGTEDDGITYWFNFQKRKLYTDPQYKHILNLDLEERAAGYLCIYVYIYIR